MSGVGISGHKCDKVTPAPRTKEVVQGRHDEIVDSHGAEGLAL